MRIFLHASRHHFDNLALGGEVIGHILRLAGGDPIGVSSRCYEHLRRLLPESAFSVEPTEPIVADLAVSIGGDGTFLRTAQCAAPSLVPILGINAGHLGYLAGFTPESFLSVGVDSLRVEERMMLRVTSSAPLPADFVPFAVNEVALLRKDIASMISVSARLDGHDLTTYRGDGLIVSTPTGSTGYNLSAGGPIIEPTAPVMVISPVAPHALAMRPLVVGAQSRVSLMADSRADGCLLSLDSRLIDIPVNSSVEITRAPFPLKLVEPRGANFIQTLRTKLAFGS